MSLPCSDNLNHRLIREHSLDEYSYSGSEHEHDKTVKPSAAPRRRIDCAASICNGANQATVFGWDHCHYGEVTAQIAEEIGKPLSSYPIKKLFNLTAGVPNLPERLAVNATTVEGRKINLIEYDENCDERTELRRRCKNVLTNIVLENYKRKKEGLPLIPVLFCIDADNNYDKPCTMANIASKNPTYNRQYTYKELRRVYKLCTHENPAIRQVAQETFKFVRVARDSLTSIEAPWADAEASALCWAQRKGDSKSKTKPPGVNWNAQLTRLIAAYDAEREPPAPGPLSLVPGNIDEIRENYSAPQVIEILQGVNE